MTKCHWFWFFILAIWKSNSTELKYPVGRCVVDGQPLQFIMHQKSIDCLELWIYNEQTGEEYKALSNFYKPASVRILPDLSGFSFLHNDAVYIKYFNKRSPKRIEFYEPLYGINTIEWLDVHYFYFSAREHRRFRIYISDLEGTVKRLVSNDSVDVLYPQIIDNELFYIERDDHQKYRISKIYYKLNDNKEVLIEVDKQIAFLNMISSDKGFFLEYPRQILIEQEFIQFSYYQLLKQENKWSYKWLFDFQVPTIYVVDGPKRIYESIVPFLPVYSDERREIDRYNLLVIN